MANFTTAALELLQHRFKFLDLIAQDVGGVRALFKSQISGQVENLHMLMLTCDKSILQNQISYRHESNLSSHLGHSKTQLIHVFSCGFAIEADLFQSSMIGTKL